MLGWQEEAKGLSPYFQILASGKKKLTKIREKLDHEHEHEWALLTNILGVAYIFLGLFQRPHTPN